MDQKYKNFQCSTILLKYFFLFFLYILFYFFYFTRKFEQVSLLVIQGEGIVTVKSYWCYLINIGVN
jgi:hypothetical protein